jgi:hypothetical protein
LSDPRIAGPAKFSSSVIEGSVNYFATVDAQSPYAGATADKPYVIEAQMSGNRASSAAPRSERRQLGTDQASSGRWMSLKLLPALVVFALDVSDVSIT